MINLFGTAMTVELVKKDFPTWTLEVPHEFVGGWVAWVKTDLAEDRIVLWIGNDYRLLTQEQAEDFISWYQEGKRQ